MQINLFKEAVVWSKHNCSACDTVKDILTKNNYHVDVRNIDDPKNMMDLMKSVPGARSVPQVMIGGKYIGGLQQVREYLNRK